MKEIKLLVNESLLANVESILAENGLGVQSIVSIVLKKIEKENGIDFLFGQYNACATVTRIDEAIKQPNVSSEARMTKNIAKRILGIPGNNITFSSKNTRANYYWANPSLDCLKADWYLILNDWQRKELHLFKVPAKSLNNLISRSDQPNLIDLQIAYNDPTFTDNRSGISFKVYFVETINY